MLRNSDVAPKESWSLRGITWPVGERAAVDAIREVGPGKHFLGCAHTQANFETAFYHSPIADNNSVEQWER